MFYHYQPQQLLHIHCLVNITRSVRFCISYGQQPSCLFPASSPFYSYTFPCFPFIHHCPLLFIITSAVWRTRRLKFPYGLFLLCKDRLKINSYVQPKHNSSSFKITKLIWTKYNGLVLQMTCIHNFQSTINKQHFN